VCLTDTIKLEQHFKVLLYYYVFSFSQPLIL